MNLVLSKQVYPRYEPWDYILNPQEDQRLEELKKLRIQIKDAQEEFTKEGPNILEPWLFEKPNKNRSENIFITSKTMIDLHKSINKFQKNKNEEWLIKELHNCIFERLARYPTNGVRQDKVHKGIRLWSYGFWDIYYFYNGKDIYITHIIYDKNKIS